MLPVFGLRDGRNRFLFLFMTQYLTKQGLKNLQNELHENKTVKRPEATKRIEEAKSLGDLSENAEYHEAKEVQAMIEGRIFEIEDILKNYLLIEEDVAPSKKVRVGSTVHLLLNGKERVYTIVGSNEANPLAGTISNESPIGQALLGNSVKDDVSVSTPAGTHVYKIVSIS